MSSSDSFVVLITGANKGLGLEAVKIVSKSRPSWTVLLGSRSQANGDKALKEVGASNVKVQVIDVTSQSSIDSAVEQIKSQYGGLDILVHNSGVAPSGNDAKAAQEVFDVNIHGVYNTQRAFEPILRAGGKSILVGSGVVPMCYPNLSLELQKKIDNIDETDYPAVKKLSEQYIESLKTGKDENNFWPSGDKIGATFGSYGISKVLVTAYYRHYAQQHKDKIISIVDPGYCATDLNKNAGPRPASDGGLSIAWTILNPTENGQFYFDGQPHSYQVASDTFSPSKLRGQNF